MPIDWHPLALTPHGLSPITAITDIAHMVASIRSRADMLATIVCYADGVGLRMVIVPCVPEICDDA